MSVSPFPFGVRPQKEDASGNPRNGATWTFYDAGTTDLATTWTDSTGATANDNPLSCNSLGQPESSLGVAVDIYALDGHAYDVVFKDSGGTTVDTYTTIYTVATGNTGKWIDPLTATRTSATTFTVTGDQTTRFEEGTELKTTGGADRYSTVDGAVYTTLTTVTVRNVNDGASPPVASTLHASMDTVYTSIEEPNHRILTASLAFSNFEFHEARPVIASIDFGGNLSLTNGTDDWTSALNAALADGKQTLLPPGTYTTSGTVSLTSNQQLMGSGQGVSVIRHTANTSCLVVNAKTNVLIKDLTVYGTDTFTNTSEVLIRVLEQVHDLTILRCETYNSGRNGISIQQSAAGREPTNVHVLSCHSHDNQGNGIFFNGVNGGSIKDCYCKDNGQSAGDANNVGYGLVVDAYWDNDPKDITISGNTLENNAQGGMIALASEGLVIDGNTAKDNGSATFVDTGDNYGNGIYVRWKDSTSDNRTVNTYPSDITVSNNRVKNSYGHGIKCENGENYTIADNNVKDSGLSNATFDTNGIHIFNTGSNVVTTLSVTGNTVKQLTAGEHVYGIYLKGCQHGTITGNAVYDCTTTGIYSYGDATVSNIGLNISDNQIYDDNATTQGILCEYTIRSKITENMIYDPLTYGVTLDANSTDNRIGDNHVYGVTTGNEYSVSDPHANTWIGDLQTVWHGTGVYDFDDDGGAQGYHVIGNILDNCYITHAWYEVLTAPTSAGAATLEIGIITDDTQAIALNGAFDGATYAAGMQDGVPDGAVANFSNKTTANRNITFRIQAADLTAGRVRVWWRYMLSE